MFKQRFTSLLQNVRSRGGADIFSDHHLVVAKIKIRLSARKKHRNPRVRYYVRKLKNQEGKQAFQLKLQTRFERLQTNENDTVEKYVAV